ncbi:hypothetical protein BH11BAC5_BH11BAC5_04330 [soil metagenome]
MLITLWITVHFVWITPNESALKIFVLYWSIDCTESLILFTKKTCDYTGALVLIF